MPLLQWFLYNGLEKSFLLYNGLLDNGIGSTVGALLRFLSTIMVLVNGLWSRFGVGSLHTCRGWGRWVGVGQGSRSENLEVILFDIGVGVEMGHGLESKLCSGLCAVNPTPRVRVTSTV